MATPDLRTVDELCRLVLAARRSGCRVRLLHVPAALRDLIALAGLADVLLDGSDQDRPVTAP